MTKIKGNRANTNDDLEEMISILREVIKYINDDSDMTWSGYGNAGKLREVLAGFISELKNGNVKVLKKMEFEFLPTGSLQEHSLSNGWADEYEILSTKMENTSKKLKNN